MDDGKKPSPVVCAIDFGTSYSGYAYGNKEDIDRICVKEWKDQSSGLNSSKTATSVLTDAQGQFHEFGFDADYKYTKLLSKNDVEGMDLYRNFKMLLHNERDISPSTLVRSTRGTARPAIDIFIMAVAYLKDHFEDSYKGAYGRNLLEDDVLWILTVPAIWSEKSKMFMRQVAYKAGLIRESDSRRLILALEPEAASIYCQSLQVDRFRGDADPNAVLFDINRPYLIVDAGGGTVDITAQEIDRNGHIKELIPASGGSWGGNQINIKFEDLLRKHFGKVCISKYKDQYPDNWHKFEMEFEKKKRATRPDGISEISFEITRAFDKFIMKTLDKDINDVLESNSDEGLVVRGDSIVITPTATLDLNRTNTGCIITHLEDLLHNTKLINLKYIFLVGGFAESEFLFRAIVTNFQGQNQYKILAPDNSSVAVLKGAVLFGLNPNKIISRVARKTYGWCIRKPFKAGEHDPARHMTDEFGEEYCNNIFRKIVTKGDEIELGKKVTFETTPFQSDAVYITKRLYYTDKTDVQYVDEEGVEKLAEIRLDTPDTTLGKDRKIKTTVVFSGTEMKIKAKDSSSNTTVKAIIDFSSGPNM